MFDRVCLPTFRSKLTKLSRWLMTKNNDKMAAAGELLIRSFNRTPRLDSAQTNPEHIKYFRSITQQWLPSRMAITS
jgi:hypothetical protein